MCAPVRVGTGRTEVSGREPLVQVIPQSLAVLVPSPSNQIWALHGSCLLSTSASSLALQRRRMKSAESLPALNSTVTQERCSGHQQKRQVCVHGTEQSSKRKTHPQRSSETEPHSRWHQGAHPAGGSPGPMQGDFIKSYRRKSTY